MNKLNPNERQMLLVDEFALAREIEELERDLELVKTELAVVKSRLKLMVVKI